MRKQQPNIYKQAERFARLTKTMIFKGNLERAKKCFLLAEDLMAKGTNETKTVITNIYVFSVSQFMELYGYSVKKLFPTALYKEYLKQVNYE